MPGKSYNEKEAFGKCLSDEQLYGFLEKLLPNAESQAVQEHLGSCSACFDEMVILARTAHTPASTAEKLEITRLRQRTPQQQVAEILDYVETEGSLAVRSPIDEVTFSEKIWKGIANLFRMEGPPSYFSFPSRRSARAWKLGFAVVALLVISSGSYWGISYYNASNRIRLAEDVLKKNYRVYIEDTPRLSGGYETKGIGVLMAGEDAAYQPSYLTQASALAKATLESGRKSAQARQLLAKISIIAKDYRQADSLLNQLEPEAANSATLLNDWGVLCFEKEDWQTATRYFESAIKLDPKLVEARYNLALAQIRLGASAEALAILNEYIDLETDEGWKAAAEELRKKLK